jgi:predicted RNA-binding Zn-ribbon protein involved in translation (DUF1610 family)
MLQAKQKEVLYVKKELVFECPHCGMKYILYAVLGENEDRLNQAYMYYCPHCGAKYLENSTQQEVFVEEEA